MGARRQRVLCCVAAGGLLLVGGAAMAQGAPRTAALVPSLTLSQTFTDNYRLSGTNPESDAVTRVGVGLGYRARTGLLQGFLDYALTGVHYARHSSQNTFQNSLNANLQADVLPDRLQVVMAAGITQGAVSAFGVQPGAGTDANPNTTEVRTLRLTPTLRGPLGPDLRYNATASQQISRSVGSTVGDLDTTAANLQLAPISSGRLRWAAEASLQKSTFKQGRSSQTNRVFGDLILALNDLDLQLSAKVGLERTDQVTVAPSTYGNWGLGLTWSPSPVTRLTAETESRYYGQSHAIALEHRTPRTVFRLRQAREASTDSGAASGNRLDAFEQLLDRLLGAQSDPAQRARLRQALAPSFLQSAASLNDSLVVSAAWTGPRNTAELSLSRTKSSRLDPLSNAVDDLSRSNGLVQTSLAMNLAHRLTPLSSLNLFLTVQRGSGQTAVQSNSQNTAELQYTLRRTPDSTLGLTLRRAHYKTGLVPYDETAASATYGLRF